MYDSIVSRPVALVRVPYRGEGGESAPAGIVERRRREGERTARRQLPRKQRAALVTVELPVGGGARIRCIAPNRCATCGRAVFGARRVPAGGRAQRVDQLAHRVVVRVRVLAHVERREVQAEGRQRAHRALDPALRDQAAAVLHQRVAHEPQVGVELRDAAVVAPGLVRQPAREPAAGVHELLLDRRELQPVRLLGVQPEEARLHLGEQLEVARERRLQVRRRSRDPDGARQVAPQHVHDANRVADAVVVLQAEHAAEAVRADVRVPVAVAADPAAERERPRHGVRLELEPPQLVRELVQHVRGGVRVQVVEVPDRVARLVDDVGPGDAQLVGLPQEVDRLLEARRCARLAALEQLGDLAQLVEHGPPCGLRGVRREHGPHAEPRHLRRQLLARDPRRLDAVHRLRQPASVAGPQPGQLAPAMHLLGDVREVEVRGERAHQPDRGDRLDLRQQRAGGLPVRPDQPADALHELEQRLPLLAHERPPEHRAELADVAPEAGVALSRGMCCSCVRRHTRRGRRRRRGRR